jgi:hypothetical protein
MAKSPWKLLTGLLSRRMVADQPDIGQTRLTEIHNESDGHEANSTAVEASVEGEPEPGPKPLAASQADKAEAGNRQEPPPSMLADVPDTNLVDGGSAATTDRTVLVIGAKRLNRQERAHPAPRRKAKAKTSGHARDVERAIVLPEQAALGEPDPTRALDKEIQKLRSQLRVKLRLQNDQLRQMLSRFEPK